LRVGPIVHALLPVLLVVPVIPIAGQATPPQNKAAVSAPSGVSVSVYERARVENWQWFAAPPKSETYSYAQSLLRVGLSQTVRTLDWQLELSQPSVLWAPDDAISPVTAQGQMGLGATYYAANGNNRNAAAAFLKQGYLRYHFGEDKNVRIGRFEFFDGLETKPKTQISRGFRPTASRSAWLVTSDSAPRNAALTGSMGITAMNHGI